MENVEVGHRMSGHFLRFAFGAFVLLMASACGDTPAGVAETPTAPAGMFSILPTTEPPIVGDQFGIVIDLANTPTQTPDPTATPEPTPTQTPDPTATPEPTPTQTPDPTATPEPTPTQTPEPTATPEPAPTQTSEPTVTPVQEATAQPTETPDSTATTTNSAGLTDSPDSGNALHQRLCSAVYYANEEIAQILIDGGADFDSTCGEYDGRTPLGIAVFYGQEELVQILINAGANANADPINILCSAVYYGRGEIAQILIDGDADVNAECQGYRYETPLGIAVYYGREELVQILIDAGATE